MYVLNHSQLPTFELDGLLLLTFHSLYTSSKSTLILDFQKCRIERKKHSHSICNNFKRTVQNVMNYQVLQNVLQLFSLFNLLFTLHFAHRNDMIIFFPELSIPMPAFSRARCVTTRCPKTSLTLPTAATMTRWSTFSSYKHQFKEKTKSCFFKQKILY